MNGVTLLAIGSHSYLLWALNMAASIRYHSPTISIQLICSEEISLQVTSKRSFFDVVTVLNKADYTDAQGLFPAKIKTSLYKFAAFEKTLYLDVDGVIFKDIAPLFDCDEDFATDVNGLWREGVIFDAMKWAKMDVLCEHFALPANSVLPAINSSALLFKKCPRAEMLFGCAHDTLMRNPLPREKMWHKWGRGVGAQPDELYFNVAFAKMDWQPRHLGLWFFRMSNAKDERPSVEWIKHNHYAVGLFGNKQTNSVFSYHLYNSFCKQSWPQGEHMVRAEHLMDSKYANQKFTNGKG